MFEEVKEKSPKLGGPPEGERWLPHPWIIHICGRASHCTSIPGRYCGLSSRPPCNRGGHTLLLAEGLAFIY